MSDTLTPYGEALRLVQSYQCHRFHGATAQVCAERRVREGHYPRCEWCDCALLARADKDLKALRLPEVIGPTTEMVGEIAALCGDMEGTESMEEVVAGVLNAAKQYLLTREDKDNAAGQAGDLSRYTCESRGEVPAPAAPSGSPLPREYPRLHASGAILPPAEAPTPSGNPPDAGTWEGNAHGLTTLLIERDALAAQVETLLDEKAKLERELAEMTADRDIWMKDDAKQNDALGRVIAKRDAALSRERQEFDRATQNYMRACRAEERERLANKRADAMKSLASIHFSTAQIDAAMASTIKDEIPKR